MPRALLKVERQRSVREIIGRVDVAASAASVGKGTGFSVAYTAAGKYTITLLKPGRFILYASATPIEATDATGHYAKVKSKTEASAVVFNVYADDATDGALVDNVSFYFRICVQDHA